MWCCHLIQHNDASQPRDRQPKLFNEYKLVFAIASLPPEIFTKKPAIFTNTVSGVLSVILLRMRPILQMGERRVRGWPSQERHYHLKGPLGMRHFQCCQF